MQYSCGILFYKDGNILIGRGYGQTYWDLPKGKMELGESFLQAAIRECTEEIGFDVESEDLIFLGEVSYQKKKRLALYFYNNVPPYLNELDLTNNPSKSYFYEVRYIKAKECFQYLTPRMCRSIYEALKQYIKDDI